jgi:MFS family permease
MFGMTVNVTANSSIQMTTDPAMRGRVMALYMMVFMGGAPLGAPIAGWVTDAYGVRAGLALGGAITAAAAVTIALVLARVGGLRLSVGWNQGHPHARFVPREQREQREQRDEQLATAA